MSSFENPGAVLIALSVVLSILAGIALILAAFAVAAAWGWRGAMARQEDGRWPIGRKLLIAGISLLSLGLLEVVLIVSYFFIVVAE
jgi:hypothetical protein